MTYCVPSGRLLYRQQPGAMTLHLWKCLLYSWRHFFFEESPHFDANQVLFEAYTDNNVPSIQQSVGLVKDIATRRMTIKRNALPACYTYAIPTLRIPIRGKLITILLQLNVNEILIDRSALWGKTTCILQRCSLGSIYSACVALNPVRVGVYNSHMIALMRGMCLNSSSDVLITKLKTKHFVNEN